MIYQPGNEKAAEASVAYMLPTQPEAMADEPKIKRTRKILMIILVICIALLVICTVFVIFGHSVNASPFNPGPVNEIVAILISIFYYSFGWIASHRHHTTSLRVFAWLGVIELVVSGIVCVVLVLFLARSLAGDGGSGEADGGMTGKSYVLSISIITYISHSVLMLVIVRLAFHLARLIKTFKQSDEEQI